MNVPLITHQIWYQGWDKLPDKFKENVRQLEELNPEFSHMKWNATSLREECAKISEKLATKFDSFPHMIQKIDLGRYVVLYNYGGVSVDTDMKPFKPLKKTPGLLGHDFIISASAFPVNLIGGVNNALIMTKKNHPILLDIITSIMDKEDNASNYFPKEFDIIFSTGPLSFYWFTYKHRKDIHILPNQYFEPCFSMDPFCSPGSDTIMDHKHELSWFNEGTRLLSQLIFIGIYFTLYIGLPLLVILIIWLYIVRFSYMDFIRRHYTFGPAFDSLSRTLSQPPFPHP
jgi:mannosyltransferase OCH1-like enzyme